MSDINVFVPIEKINQKILLIRGQKVMLDRDLAELYGVTSRALRQQVKRNSERFPGDFMFQLTQLEARSMVSQFVTPSLKMFGGHLPYAFTEQGVAMLSSVLKSKRAVAVNIQIIRSFVRLRELLSTHTELARQLEALETKYDAQFKVVFDAIRQLMEPTSDSLETKGKKEKIGFKVAEDREGISSRLA